MSTDMSTADKCQKTLDMFGFAPDRDKGSEESERLRNEADHGETAEHGTEACHEPSLNPPRAGRRAEPSYIGGAMRHVIGGVGAASLGWS